MCFKGSKNHQKLSLKEQNPHIDFLGIDKYLFLNGKLDVDLSPSMETNAPHLENMGDFIWEAFVQREVIKMGSTLTKTKPQQFCEDRNLGLMGEYANLFVALASCATLWQNKLQSKFVQQCLS